MSSGLRYILEGIERRMEAVRAFNIRIVSVKSVVKNSGGSDR